MQYVLKLVLLVIMAHKELRNDTWPYQIPLRDGFLLTPIVSSEIDTYTYVQRLYPSFSTSNVQETVQQYTNIGLSTVDEQAVAIMGECMFPCRYT